MTPNVRGLGAALAKLKHDLDVQAGGFLDELSQLGTRATAAMGKAKAKVAETRAAVEEIEAFAADEGSNGGPTLEASPASQVSSTASVAVPEAAQAAPEQLTTNGVSVG